jgi:hypothetical protein
MPVCLFADVSEDITSSLFRHTDASNQQKAMRNPKIGTLQVTDLKTSNPKTCLLLHKQNF